MDGTSCETESRMMHFKNNFAQNYENYRVQNMNGPGYEMKALRGSLRSEVEEKTSWDRMMNFLLNRIIARRVR